MFCKGKKCYLKPYNVLSSGFALSSLPLTQLGIAPSPLGFYKPSMRCYTTEFGVVFRDRNAKKQ